MASSLFTRLGLFIIFCSICPCTQSSQPQSSEPSFSISVIHRDSPLSPLYNPNATKFDRVRELYRRTVSRAQYLKQMADGVSPEAITAYVYTDIYEYVMSYYIGTPEKQVFAIVDTASSLIWIQCLPCERCFNQTSPIHDPSESDSYRKMACDDPRCPHMSECVDGFCAYYRAYGDGSFSQGVIGTDTFVFIDDSAHYYQTRIENIIFGCGHVYKEPMGGKMMGIVGFSRQPLSLLSQLKVTKFSHCFFSYKSEFSSSWIHFGDEAMLTGPKTPILFVPKLPFVYFLILDGITVGDERLELPPDTFKVTKSGENGFFIDTGCTYTRLRDAAHSELVDAVSSKIDMLNETSDIEVPFSLCYEVDNLDTLVEYAPDIIFHFSGGIDMKWNKYQTYVQVQADAWCLAVVYDDENSVLGNYQMMGYNIGYDIAENFLYLDYRDTCEGT